MPSNAVYGHVPYIFPLIDQIERPNTSSEASPGLIRRAHRLKEISDQAMVEGSARARLGRSAKARSTPAGQKLNLSVGEEVDFYRDQSNKDTSGWFGPAQVIDVSRLTCGIVTLKWMSRVMEAQIQNVRRQFRFLSVLMVNDRDCGGGVICRATANRGHGGQEAGLDHAWLAQAPHGHPGSRAPDGMGWREVQGQQRVQGQHLCV